MIIQILTSAVLIYLAWALFHHRRDKSLTYVVFIEYLLIAILVLIVLLGVIM